VLSNIAKNNNFKELSKVSATGDDLVETIKIDTDNDLTSVSFAQVWQVCEKNGASLSPVLSSFNQQIRTENELRQELSSSLAGVKLSAYVLAFLPIIGIFLASILGVNSINWLANSSFGKISLAIALILEFVGIIWVRRLVNQVESLL
jgi:tight adherence protein B